MSHWIFVKQTEVPWTPESIPSPELRMWHKADGTLYSNINPSTTLATNNNDIVRLWTAASANAASASLYSSSDSGTPVLKTNVLNGLPTVHFTGVRGLWRPSSTIFSNNPSSLATFIVFRRNATGSKSGTVVAAMGIGSGGTAPSIRQFDSTTFAVSPLIVMLGVNTGNGTRYNSGFYTASNAWVIASLKMDIANDATQIRLNGGAASANLTTPYNASTYGAATQNVTIGAKDGETAEPWDGDIAEVLVFTNDVTTDTRDKAEGYLAHKWGLTASLPAGHPYKSVAPTV